MSPIRTEQGLDLLGSYGLDTVSGTMAAGLAAAAPVYSCRWGDPTKLMLLRKLSIEMNSLGVGFAAGLALFEAVIARAFTVSDTGGTSILPIADNQKRRTSNAVTAMTDLRQASTASLVAGTRTLDAQAFGAIRAQIDATVNKTFVPGAAGNPHAVLFEAPHYTKILPIVFAQNEGFVIRASVPATGTWEFRVLTEWQEATSY